MSEVVTEAEEFLRHEANRGLLGEDVNALLAKLNVEIAAFNEAVELRAQQLAVDVRVFALAMIHVHQFDRRGGDAGESDTASSSTP